jgi:K+-transporting ATPase ATPase A chain
MTSSDFLQVALFIAILMALSPMLGSYMASVFSGERTILASLFSPVEWVIYNACRVHEDEEMTCGQYMLATAVFSLLSMLVFVAILRFQGELVLNPQGFAAMPWPLAINTAVSFVTNTNWQAYAGESTLSYFSQLAALTVQNFASAAVGMAVLIALTRGFVRKNSLTIGNFWVDVTRAVLYVLLPLSFLWAITMMAEGVIQNVSSYVEVTTLDGGSQILPMGPVASQVAIKQLGTNGGGFFGANSAHPFENPTPLSNFLQMLAILLLPASLIYTFGVLTSFRRHALMLYSVTLLFFFSALAISLWSEFQPNNAVGIARNWEGKELRFGLANSVLWGVATTSASNGSVDSMHASMSPLAGGLFLFNMLSGEVIFGGVGSGLYGLLLFVLLTVFLAGLMVGRTPEYLGKKIEAKEMKWVLVAILTPILATLFGSALSLSLTSAQASISSGGPHGLTELLYNWASTANNNGSSFAGFHGGADFYNWTFAVAMLLGRFGVMFPVLLIAGSFAKKTTSKASLATFSTEGFTFAALLLGTILIVGVLTYFPVFILGPVAEHMLMQAGYLF